MEIEYALEICIDASSRCEKECRACADRCSDMIGMEDVAGICMRCAKECRDCLEAMQEGSTTQCYHCESLCKACANECGKIDFEFTKGCAAICRECAQACREAAAA